MTNEEVFYDIKSVPLSDRESFNNTILLLTMVKSKYYYIIGFSRPEETITIGFDFESKTEGVFTKELVVDFGKSDKEIILYCTILDTSEVESDKHLPVVYDNNAHFCLDNGKLCYKRKMEKDKIFPSSVKVMNNVLLTARNEILTFLSQYG